MRSKWNRNWRVRHFGRLSPEDKNLSTACTQNRPIQEIVILGGLLCLLWSGLRFGDIQRSHLATWQLDGSALRGLTWRSKTSNSATPFGICVSGLLSKGTLAWIHRYLQTLDELYRTLDISAVDFALPSFGGTSMPIWPPQAMSYGEALFFFDFS